MVKITPTITWATPRPITYGTSLSSTQLNSSINATVYTVTYIPTYGDVLDAGTKTLTVTYVVDATDPTYTQGIYEKSVNLIVNKKSLIITANNLTITYGDSLHNSDLSYTSDGLTNGDTITNVNYKISPKINGAGKYSIIPLNASGTGLKNYDITYLNGVLTVEKKSAYVIINNLTITYGEPIPTFTYSVSGLVDNNTISKYPNIYTDATTFSAPGKYIIEANIGPDPNYILYITNGVLTISALKKRMEIFPNKINDRLVIPKIFYEDVIHRNKIGLIEKIKYNPWLSTAVIKFYNLVLMEAFVYKKNSKVVTPYRVTWQNINDENILLYPIEQTELYQYIVQTFLPNGTIISNFGYLVNTINNYLVSLRLAMVRINNKLSAQFYFPLGVNVKNDVQMKLFIKQFI